ncbi:hypothetical protein KA050_03240 [Candidatus Gracilibacteria bacterium]|nr:hypothetical protein [Candidatus Gracilibacteria bacterium]
MQKIQLKKILIFSVIILIIATLLGVLNLNISGLKSNVINDCSAEQSAVNALQSEIQGYQDDIDVYNDDIGIDYEDLREEQKALDELYDEYTAETDPDEKGSLKKDWQEANQEFQKSQTSSTAYRLQKQAGITASEDLMKEAQKKLSEAEKALKECEDKLNDSVTDTTSGTGTDTTSGTGTDTTSGTGTDTTSGTGTDTTSGTGTDTTSGTGTDTTSGTGTDTTSGTTGGSTEYCGDGTCNNGESSDTCSPDCPRSSYCGDGTVDSGEGCDDSNTSAGDGCSDLCQTEAYCGNNVKEGDEECDGSDTEVGYTCDASCVTECEVEGYNPLQSSWFGLGKKCEPKKGCTYSEADNYDKKAEVDDGSCTCNNGLSVYNAKSHQIERTCSCEDGYREEGGMCKKGLPKGCTNVYASNYTKGAIEDDKSCTCENGVDPYKYPTCRDYCDNGLNVTEYPTCECPDPWDTIEGGKCVSHGNGRKALIWTARIVGGIPISKQGKFSPKAVLQGR